MPGSARVIQVYDIQGNVVNMPPQPIISKRDPTSNDREELGTLWVNKSNNSVWCLVEVAGPTCTWVTSPASGVGTFTSVDVTPGNVHLTGAGGSITIDDGDLTVTNGDFNIGGQVSVTGDLYVTGNIITTDSDQIELNSTYDGAQAIYLHANGGTSEAIEIYSEQGTGAASVSIHSLAGGITVASGKSTASAVTVNTTAGGMSFNATGAAGKDIVLANTGGSVSVTASESVTDAIVLNATGAAGGIQLKSATGTVAVATDATTPTINVGNIAPTVSRTTTINGGTVVTAAVTDLLTIAAGGATTNADSVKRIDIATGNVAVGQNIVNIATGNRASGTHTTSISTGTGTKTVTIGNADGLTSIGLNGTTSLNTSVNAATNINTGTSTGAVTIGNALADAISVDSGAGISLDAQAASNFTVTGAADLTLSSTAGAVNIDSGKDAASCIYLRANAGTSETINIHADQGTGDASVNVHSDVGGITLDGGKAAATAVNIAASDVAGGVTVTTGTAGLTVTSTGAVSLGAAAASDLTVTGAFDVTVATTLGSANITAGEAAADAVYLHASDVAGGITATSGTGGLIASTTGVATIDSAGASYFKVTGAFDLTAQSTAGSVVIDGGEAAADAVQITASDVAGGVTVTAGTGGISLNAGGDISATVATDSQASPTATATIDHRIGSATFTGFTTAAAATEVFTISNSLVTAGSVILVTVNNLGANDAQMALTRVQPGAGSFVVTTQNLGAAALNGDVVINFWVIS